MTRTTLSVLIILSVMVSTAFAQQKPDWVDNNGVSVQYPEGVYITGYGIGEDESPADRRTTAEQSARSDLSSKFIVRIQSELVSEVKESSRRVDSNVRNTINSQTQLNLINVDSRYWDDTRRRRSYALAVMEIASAIKNYSTHRDDLVKQIQSLITSAEGYEKSGNLRQAITGYRKTFPLFIELGETTTILRLIQGRSAFPENSESQISVPLSQPDIESRISKIAGGEDIGSVRGCAVSLAEQLNSQYASSALLAVFPFKYRDTDFLSQFSGSFLPVLEAELITYYKVVSRDGSGQFAAKPHDLLTGTFWVENDKVRVLAFITDLDTGSKKASASLEVQQEIFTKAGMELKPRNFLDAQEDLKVFMKQDVIPSTLSIEVWTAKGDKNLIFREKEETPIFVRVNKPCYLQFIYHMANGVRLLLYNNFYIDISRVNYVITLPDTFYFAPPLGVERLQVFANTGKFDEVKITTARYDGEEYDNVLAGDFAEHTNGVRGIKKKEPEKEVTEKIVTITTVP